MALTKKENRWLLMVLIMELFEMSFVPCTLTTKQSDNSDSIQSDIDDKIMQMNNERNRHLAQMQDLEISHDVQISRLNSEYEQKMADLQKPAVAQDNSPEIQSVKDEIEPLQKRL